MNPLLNDPAGVANQLPLEDPGTVSVWQFHTRLAQSYTGPEAISPLECSFLALEIIYQLSSWWLELILFILKAIILLTYNLLFIKWDGRECCSLQTSGVQTLGIPKLVSNHSDTVDVPYHVCYHIWWPSYLGFFFFQPILPFSLGGKFSFFIMHVFTKGALLISFKNFSFAFTTWLTDANGLSPGLSWLWPCLGFKVRAVWFFLSLGHFEATVKLFLA